MGGQRSLQSFVSFHWPAGRDAAPVPDDALQSAWITGGRRSQQIGAGVAVAMAALQGPKEHIPRP